MKFFLFLFSLLPLTSFVMAQTNFSSKTIKSDHLSAKVYLPDAENGYYRSCRFDWAGVIGNLQYEGHEYFGNWLPEHDPLNPESISGPVEAFYPIDYDEGDTFLIIGIGVLRKPDNKPYHHMRRYEIINSGKWEVNSTEDKITMIHTLSYGDYAYQYTKTLRLSTDEPKLVLEHQLKNTGKKSLETTVYNHNFFIIDGETTGPNILTTFGYEPEAQDGRGFGEVATIQGNQLIYQAPLQKGKHVFTPDLQGYSSSVEDYDIRIENTKSGAGVHITADRPLLKMVYWASHTTACPEPYIQVNVASREDFTWDIAYEFYLLDK
ncbi:MAG: hypothetical protein AAF632_12140 [Bacteroidota bacterium]